MPESGWDDGPADAPGNVAGFSLHAGVAVKPCQRDKLERLCRYICRPPVSEKRLFLTPRGDIGYSLKMPYRGPIRLAPAQHDGRAIRALRGWVG